jgi:hypothetical protein
MADPWIIGNEFACVAVSLDGSGHDLRLKIEDLGSGKTIHLDALILASLAREQLDNLARHLLPAPNDDE